MKTVRWLISVVSCSLVLLSVLGLPGRAGAQTLAEIEERGLLSCGVTVAGVGIVEVDAAGRWVGFFPDMCRALAAAILGDAEAVSFVRVDANTRFDALRNGAFDVLMGGTTWTMSRDLDLDLTFPAIVLYDGQSFLAHRSLGVNRLDDLDGPASICVSANTTSHDNLLDLVARERPNLEIHAHQSQEGRLDALFARSCDMLSTDRLSLVGVRASRTANPEDFMLLEDVISREPLAPAIRDGDNEWADVVRWVMFALILAEEHGLTADTVDAPQDGSASEVLRLLGQEGTFGAMLGLPQDWAYQTIRQVGNYGEIFERNLGAESPLGLGRGLNDLWTRGGLIYAPPLR